MFQSLCRKSRHKCCNCGSFARWRPTRSASSSASCASMTSATNRLRSDVAGCFGVVNDEHWQRWPPRRCAVHGLEPALESGIESGPTSMLQKQLSVVERDSMIWGMQTAWVAGVEARPVTGTLVIGCQHDGRRHYISADAGRHHSGGPGAGAGAPGGSWKQAGGRWQC